LILTSTNGCGPTRATTEGHASVRKGVAGTLVVTPDVIDLGTTKERERRLLVRLSNLSSNRIRLIGTEKSCGCQSAEIQVPADVPPHAEIRLPLRVVLSESTRGRVAQSVTLVTDEEDANRHDIAVRGNLLGEFRVALQPEVLDFGKVGGWSSPEKTVRLVHPHPDGLGVSAVKSSRPGLKVSPHNGQDDAYSYAVKLPVDFQPGPFREEVVFETSAGSATLLVMGKKMGPVFMSPDFLVCERTKPASKLIRLHHFRESPIDDIVPQATAARIHVLEKSLNVVDDDSLVSSIKVEISDIPSTVRSFDLLLRNNIRDVPAKVFVTDR